MPYKPQDRQGDFTRISLGDGQGLSTIPNLRQKIGVCHMDALDQVYIPCIHLLGSTLDCVRQMCPGNFDGARECVLNAYAQYCGLLYVWD
jgi:hypothetical protein